MRKQVIQKDLRRKQQASVTNNYRSAAVLPISFRITVGSKCGKGKSTLTENNQRVGEHCSKFHSVWSPLHLS